MPIENQASVSKKPKKATYLRRKEEHEALTNQISSLQQQLANSLAKSHGGATKRLEFDQALRQNEALEEAMEQYSLQMATTQSFMSEWMQNLSGNPMSVHIYLPREWTQRHETLLKIKDERLSRGYRYVTARCQSLSPLKPHLTEERFEDANGDFCCIVNEVIPFPGIKSMRKVFETIKYAVNTLEISISEQSGDITIREDYHTVGDDSFVSNYRLTSKQDGGVTTELNAVSFGQYIEDCTKYDGRPYAVFAFDSVDQDDLHPYHPQECVRKDINGTNVLIAVPRKANGKMESTSDTQEESELEDEVVIVKLRSFFFRTYRPKFQVSEVTLQDLQRNVTRWGEVYVHYAEVPLNLAAAV